MRNNNNYRVLQHRGSIEVQTVGHRGGWADAQALAMYASTNPRKDGPRMFAEIKKHLDNGGTLYNYQW